MSLNDHVMKLSLELKDYGFEILEYKASLHPTHVNTEEILVGTDDWILGLCFLSACFHCLSGHTQRTHRVTALVSVSSSST